MTPIEQWFSPFVDDSVVSVDLVCTEGDYENYQSALDDDHDVARHDNKLRDDGFHWASPSRTLNKEIMERGG